MEEIKITQENFPFISGIKYQETEFIGIIQNYDEKVLSLYDFCALKSEKDKKVFLELGEIWYWESNRKLPINIFLYEEMKQFRYALRTFNMKDTTIVFGIATSLNDLLKKRIKKKQIQLIHTDSSNKFN